MADFFTVLPKFVKEMNKAELEEYFRPGIKECKQNKKGEWIETPFYTKAYLVRSIIMNELKFNKIDYERTLRGIWYSSVKPTLEKLGILEDADMDEDELIDFDILQLGKDGRRLIPIDDTCSDEKDEEIKQFAKFYFKSEN